MLDSILILVLAICLYTDIRFKKIYNKVLIPAAIIAITGNIFAGGLNAGLLSLKGMLFGMGLLFIPFVMGGMGAGDVKLLGVVGAFKGHEFVCSAFLATAIAGGILALYVMARSGLFKLRLKMAWYTFLSLFHIVPRVNMFDTVHNDYPHQSFPYAIAITAGTLVAYLLRV